MKVRYGKRSIDIIPESEADEVYLESVLDLQHQGSEAVATRIAPMGLPHAWAYVRVGSRQER